MTTMAQRILEDTAHAEKMRLADAAPDMLAALRTLLQDCNDSRLSGPGWDSLRASIAYARAAVAKAEGRS